MKLILINGPTGIGKSTTAQRIHKELPLSLLLDIDAQRRYINDYREYRKESLALVLELTLGMVDKHLDSGHDVIVDKVFIDSEVTAKFLDLGKKHGADTFEFVLNADKDTLIKRADERGFKEKSLLTSEKVVKFWELTQEYLKDRHEVIILDTDSKDSDEVFKYIMNKI